MNVGVPELVGSHLEVDAIYHAVVVGGPLSEDGGHGMRNLLAIDIAVVGSLPDGASAYIAPHPTPLCF